jgi:hypothetical protein
VASLNALSVGVRSILYATSAALFVTGVAWTLLHYLDGSLGGQSMLMKLHGGLAMIALVLLGMLLAKHVPAGWRTGANKRSGISMLGASALLAISGYLLYYAGDEAVRAFASYFHTGIGLAIPIVLGLHVWRLAVREL